MLQLLCLCPKVTIQQKLSCVVELTFSFFTVHKCEKQEYRTWFSHLLPIITLSVKENVSITFCVSKNEHGANQVPRLSSPGWGGIPYETAGDAH